MRMRMRISSLNARLIVAVLLEQQNNMPCLLAACYNAWL